MTPAETLIRSMSKAGSSARAIATELYDRELRMESGKAFSPDMVEGFLRHIGIELPEPKKPPVQVSEQLPRHSKEAEPIGEPIPKVRMLRPWPLHTDFSRDNLYVRG